MSLSELPERLGHEIRYALHRHAGTTIRSYWQPAALQQVVDTLATARAQSINDPVFTALSAQAHESVAHRIWTGLPVAARGLAVTAESAKAAGWFDPILVGAPPFAGVQFRHRRVPWDLTVVSQPWLRDLLWDYLRDQALQPAGKRPGGSTIVTRVHGIALLSAILHRSRTDHGLHPQAIGKHDATVVKQTWDLWFQEQVLLPIISPFGKGRVLTEANRMQLMCGMRSVLRTGREQARTVPELDPFILSLPEYPHPARRPRPRPLNYDDFQLLISPENLRLLDGLDTENSGFSDVWLTQAFQGGRIGDAHLATGLPRPDRRCTTLHLARHQQNRRR
ncbi:hypothetical protein ACTD5D_22935 [Nocardia takedensis]|uniref:hypothetical protein n=1 Tax=Nocardia takedensis TaxID=259390 RepID=UPI003F7726A6